MTTNWTVKLLYGSRELDLNSGRYQPELGFNPPSVAIAPLLAAGTSANRYGGGTKISERAVNRTWELNIQVSGASDTEVMRGGADLASFLSLAGTDPATPLYIAVHQNSDVGFEPLWGQAWRLYEIVHATMPQALPDISRGNRRALRATYNTVLTIKPHAVGRPQRLASATGGVIEDTIGWKDGLSRGLIVPEATTNKMTNPIFGHGTWNNGWTTGVGITAAVENTDEDFVLFGTSSAKLTSLSVANNNFYQSINVANTNAHVLSCYARLPGGGAISTTQIDLTYGGAQSTTYTAIGDNGWYRLTAGVTGVAAGTVTGVIIKGGYTVYVDGFQIEEKSYVTPLAYGDLLGNAWTGTAHASTSTRTVARARIAVVDSIALAEGTVRVIWKADKAHSAYTGSLNWPLFEEDTGELRAVWNDANTDWRFLDGTNTADSAADTFNANDVLIFHFTWSPAGGLDIYINGSADGSSATYTPPTLGTYVYLGSTDAVNNHIGGTFLDFTTYDRAMTATEVSNDYTNLSKLTADNQRVGAIPWLWTKDGDDIADNCLDSAGSTGAPHANYVVVGGVPGTSAADTEWRLQLTGGAPAAGARNVWISRLDVDEFFPPDGEIFQDYSGASAADTTYCGGDYETDTISTTTNAPASPTAVTNAIYDKHLAGREFYCFTRLYDAGSNLSLAFRLSLGLNAIIDTEYRAVSSTTVDEFFRCGLIRFPDRKVLFSNASLNPTAKWHPIAKRSTGSADVRYDFVMLMARPMIRIRPSPGLFDNSNSPDSYLVNGRNGVFFVESSDNIDDTARVEGDIIELVPEKINIMMSALADDLDDDHVITHTLTYTSVKVTPRYMLL